MQQAFCHIHHCGTPAAIALMLSHWTDRLLVANAWVLADGLTEFAISFEQVRIEFFKLTDPRKSGTSAWMVLGTP
ncbi:hypothetical protein [Parasedimentitalea maritima]|uniref:Uncharacterized protein n=1 Tax=Parasedimentitalea maritima TaxID=2578117 RepID=A0A6A4RE46_9RHOB|nr:hypothetical protein [Zongyanglinia marina]KAE9628173.1 hypothetical protein GP644_16190 [Zongyanglinia marina]